MKSLGFLISIVAISLSAITTSVHADDTKAKTKLEEARKLYAERADSDKLKAGFAAVDEAFQEAADKDLKYDVLVLKSKLYYFQAMHMPIDSVEKKKARAETFLKGQAEAEGAKVLLDDPADAYYWAGANLARWGETVGIAGGVLTKKDDLVKTLEAVVKKKTHDGNSGEECEGYGSNRVLGRVLFVLPAFAGGNAKKARTLLKVANEKAKEYSLNVYYYAILLAAGSDEDKTEAKTILDEMLKADPKTYNPNRIPESEDEFVLAKKLRDELGD